MNTDKIFAERLAAEYAPPKERRVIALKKLDRYAKRPAVIIAYVFGVTMTLLFATGLVSAAKDIILGTVLVAVGILGMAVNHPIYEKLLNKAKQRYAFDIVELAKDISEYDY